MCCQRQYLAGHAGEHDAGPAVGERSDQHDKHVEDADRHFEGSEDVDRENAGRKSDDTERGEYVVTFGNGLIHRSALTT